MQDTTGRTYSYRHTLPSMVRYRYEPIERGWITVRDPWHKLMGAINCSDGGAQKTYDTLCVDFERAGWELQERIFDNRYVRRGSIRWNLTIVKASPYKRDTHPGFMSLLVSEGHKK